MSSENFGAFVSIVKEVFCPEEERDYEHEGEAENLAKRHARLKEQEEKDARIAGAILYTVSKYYGKGGVRRRKVEHEVMMHTREIRKPGMLPGGFKRIFGGLLRAGAINAYLEWSEKEECFNNNMKYFIGATGPQCFAAVCKRLGAYERKDSQRLACRPVPGLTVVEHPHYRVVNPAKEHVPCRRAVGV